MESYKEELFINETSHRFLSPPCSADPFSKWVASYELIQCCYYFRKDYVFLLCAIARLRERVWQLPPSPCAKTSCNQKLLFKSGNELKTMNLYVCFIFTLSSLAHCAPYKVSCKAQLIDVEHIDLLYLLCRWCFSHIRLNSKIYSYSLYSQKLHFKVALFLQ